MKHVINFKSDGSVSAQYREGGRDIGFLGKQKITRASEVLHDYETQTFYVLIEDDNPDKVVPDCARGFKSYEEGREFEAAWLDDCRVAGVTPISPAGKAVGSSTRLVLLHAELG